MEQIDLNLPSEIEEIAKLQAGATVELAQESVPMDFEPNLTDASAIPSETAEVCYFNLLFISIYTILAFLNFLLIFR